MQPTIDKVDLHIQIDQDISAKATQLLHSMGLDMSTAMNMFLRQVVSKRQIPFAVEASETSLEEQFLQALDASDIPTYDLRFDEKGQVILDGLPENLVDWVVNG